jgi:hypothetical protein
MVAMVVDTDKHLALNGNVMMTSIIFQDLAKSTFPTLFAQTGDSVTVFEDFTHTEQQMRV